jgi:hypothetical protein
MFQSTAFMKLYKLWYFIFFLLLLHIFIIPEEHIVTFRLP